MPGDVAQRLHTEILRATLRASVNTPHRCSPAGLACCTLGGINVDQTSLETMTIAQVGEHAQLDKRLVSREIREGRLYAVQIGRIWRIPVAAYHAWLHGQPYTPQGTRQ